MLIYHWNYQDYTNHTTG